MDDTIGRKIAKKDRSSVGRELGERGRRLTSQTGERERESRVRLRCVYTGHSLSLLIRPLSGRLYQFHLATDVSWRASPRFPSFIYREPVTWSRSRSRSSFIVLSISHVSLWCALFPLIFIRGQTYKPTGVLRCRSLVVPSKKREIFFLFFFCPLVYLLVRSIFSVLSKTR